MGEVLGFIGMLLALFLILGCIWVYENLGDDIAHYIKVRARKFLRSDENEDK